MLDVVIDTLVTTVVNSLQTSGLIPEEDKTKFQKALDDLSRRKDSFWSDAVLLALIILFIGAYYFNISELFVEVRTSSWMAIDNGKEFVFTLAGWWFQLVSTPLLQFILFRWFWRFMLWIAFMYRVSKTNLSMQVTHADLVGGLGVLRYGANAFMFLFIIFGTMVSVSIGQDISTGEHTLAEAKYFIVGYIVSSIVLSSLPVAFFSGQLVKAKRHGRQLYGLFGYRLSKAFKEKWQKHDIATTGDELLNSIDPSALADYNAVYDTVNKMRFIPISTRQFVLQAILLSLPFLPLIFIEISFTELITRLFDSLI